MQRLLAWLASVELTPESPGSYTAVMIVTDHSSDGCDFIVRRARLVVDTWNATQRVKENRETIVRC